MSKNNVQRHEGLAKLLSDSDNNYLSRTLQLVGLHQQYDMKQLFI